MFKPCSSSPALNEMISEDISSVTRGPRRRAAKAENLNTDQNNRLTMFGKNLQAARLSQNLTQREVAAIAGVKHQYISLVERGRANLTIDSMERLSAALGVEIADMLRTDRNT